MKKYKSIDSYDYFKSGSAGKILQSPLMSALSNYDVIAGKSRVSYSLFTLRLSNIK